MALIYYPESAKSLTKSNNQTLIQLNQKLIFGFDGSFFFTSTFCNKKAIQAHRKVLVPLFMKFLFHFYCLPSLLCHNRKIKEESWSIKRDWLSSYWFSTLISIILFLYFKYLHSKDSFKSLKGVAFLFIIFQLHNPMSTLSLCSCCLGWLWSWIF